MLQKPPFHPKQARQLLRSAFIHDEFLKEIPMVTLEGDQMLGCMYIEKSDRYSFLSSIYDKYGVRDISGHGEQVVFMLPNKFHLDCEGEDSFLINLGYSYNFNANENVNNADEIFTSVLAIKNRDETIGFFKFSIEVDQYGKNIFLTINLDYIFIMKKHRNQTNSLNLTTAVGIFLSATLESIVSMLNEDEKLSVTLSARIVSKGGEKIANLIYSELEYLLETLTYDFPNKRVSKISYEVD